MTTRQFFAFREAGSHVHINAMGELPYTDEESRARQLQIAKRMANDKTVRGYYGSIEVIECVTTYQATVVHTSGLKNEKTDPAMMATNIAKASWPTEFPKPQRKPPRLAPGTQAAAYVVRVRGFDPCRLVSRKVHRGEVQVQFANGTRRWFLSSRVAGAENLP